MPAEVQSFFQGFNFDTLLALISCLTGIVALFVGRAAYKQSQINKNSFNDKKEFKDESQDHSQKAGRDIVINQNDPSALAAISAANFESSLKLFYGQLEQKASENLQTIINESKKIIEENQINLGTYTKYDWINIYLENAKHTSNVYMQVIWAKVLVKELAEPGSFSFKTLDILKNMSDEDFHLFENLCNIQINDSILQGEDTEKLLAWTSQIKLSEMGLLSLNSSRRWYTVPAQGENSIPNTERRRIIILKNKTEQDINVEYKCYYLTSSATELRQIASYSSNNEYFSYLCNTLKKTYEKTIGISLHNIIRTDGVGYRYSNEEIMV